MKYLMKYIKYVSSVWIIGEKRFDKFISMEFYDFGYLIFGIFGKIELIYLIN
jgi:hypothetical protein